MAETTNNIKQMYWLDGKWVYVDAENANNLDLLDSTDFASRTTEKRVDHTNTHMFLGNNDWSSLIYDLSDKELNYATYNSSSQGVLFTGANRQFGIATHMPIDPNSYYTIKVKVKKISGNGTFNCGILSLDNKYLPIENIRYNVASNVVVATNTEFEFRMNGYSATPNNNTFPNDANYFNIIFCTGKDAVDQNSAYVISYVEIIRSQDKLYSGQHRVWDQGNFNPSSKADVTYVDSQLTQNMSNHASVIGSTTIGHVKNGGNVTIASDGKLNTTPSSIGAYTTAQTDAAINTHSNTIATTNLGHIKNGGNITVAPDGKVNTTPTAIGAYTISETDALIATKLTDKVYVDAHIADSVKHITPAERTKWNAKADASGTVANDFNAKNITVAGNILPTQNSIQTIGTPDKRFKAIYVDEAYLSTNTLYLGDTPIMGTDADTVNIKTDPNQSICMKTSATGTTTVMSEKAVAITTSGMNSNVTIQTTGVNSQTNIAATANVNVNAPNIKLTGATTIDGDLTAKNLNISGNFNITGTLATVNAGNLEISDNIIEINKGETGQGVAEGISGIKIDRGDLNDVLLVFDEADDKFKVGDSSNLLSLATEKYVYDNRYIHPAGTNPHGTTKSDVGLSNVINESKTTMFTSPSFTGTPIAPTAADNTDTTQLATTAFVMRESAKKANSTNVYTKLETDAKIQSIINTAPEALNTLKELADALGNDPNFAGTVTTQLGLKSDKTYVDAELAKKSNVHTHPYRLDTWVPSWADVTGKPSTFTPSSHNQASDTINAMTGYSKASAVSAIVVGDTLNNAIGKLEKALDAKSATHTHPYAPDTHPAVVATTTVLGHVKAGGDISIDANGIVTVLDNSHAHIISDVTGLQTALDSKSPVHTHPYSPTGHGHNATDITEDANRRFTTDTEKATWNAKANASHGNHVPAVQTANNYTYLRNDNTWQALQNASTTVKGVVQLNNNINSTATDQAATASAVKTTYDLAASKASTATATNALNGLMSSADKTKLDSISQGAGVTQNAYSNFKIGATTISANSATDTIELIAGNGITLTADAATEKITITGVNQYTHPTGDGNLHVPANGTSNNGKFLQATATAGTYQWASLPVASTSLAGIVQLGSGATQASPGNHNHDSVYQLKESTSFSIQPNYVAVRTPSRTASQYYEFWDATIGWADIKAGEIYANSNRVYHAGNKPTPADIGAATSGHTHPELSTSYLPLTGGTLTGKLIIRGTAASDPLTTRGIQGSDGNGAIGDLYLNYGNSNPVYVNGTNKVYHEGFKPTLSDLGAAPVGHTHPYLPIVGGTMTGSVVFPSSYNHFDATSRHAINLNNSSIIGANTIVFADESDVTEEGICWPKSGKLGTSTNRSDFDILKSYQSVLYYNTNKVYHEGFKPTASDIGAAASSHNHDSVYAQTSHAHQQIQSPIAVYVLNGNAAQKICTGGVLVSNSYSDETKVPTNGVYSKGDIKTDGEIKIKSAGMRYNESTECIEFYFA